MPYSQSQTPLQRCQLAGAVSCKTSMEQNATAVCSISTSTYLLQNKMRRVGAQTAGARVIKTCRFRSRYKESIKVINSFSSNTELKSDLHELSACSIQ